MNQWKLHFQKLARLAKTKYKFECVVQTQEPDYFENGVITIFKTKDWERNYYLAVHELGHGIIMSHPNYYNDYPNIYKQPNTFKVRLMDVEEEIDAWNAGEQFLIKHKLKYNKTKFDRIRGEKLASYMLWALKLSKIWKTVLKSEKEKIEFELFREMIEDQ